MMQTKLGLYTSYKSSYKFYFLLHISILLPFPHKHSDSVWLTMPVWHLSSFQFPPVREIAVLRLAR